MGCSSSGAKQKPTVEAARRRLSVGQVDGKPDEANVVVTEQERGMISNLNQESLLDLLANDTTGTGRKFSLGSAEDKGKTSFANKAVAAEGDKVDSSMAGMGYTCRKGLKPESPNQDCWMIMVIENDFAIYGVFDGHGQKGHDVSLFVKENLPKLMVKDSRFKDHQEDGKIMTDSFKKIQNIISTADQMKKLDAQLSGTTCTVCVHSFVHNKLTFAHVADSTAVMAKYKDGANLARDNTSWQKGDPIQLKDGGGKKELVAVQITRDHKPDLKDERARIEKNGGRVVFDGYANHRIYAKNARYPGLNMSRCLGDLLGHAECGISCEPETCEIAITPDDHMVLLCSDGVWEFISSQESLNIIAKFGRDKALLAAEKLAKESWDRWIQEEGGMVVDDITALVIYLNN